MTEHAINTSTEKPVHCAPYRASFKQQEIIQREVENDLKLGTIEPSFLSWSTCLLLIPKGKDEFRTVNDYRLLNKVTIKDNYPLPNLNSCLDLSEGSKFYVALDMTGAYWQIPLAKNSREKTAFITSTGLYQNKRLPQGL